MRSKKATLIFILLLVFGVIPTLSRNVKAADRVTTANKDATMTAEEAESEYIYEKYQYQQTGDPKCPQTPLTGPGSEEGYFCGTIRSTQIDRMDPTKEAIITGKPVKNATVAIYTALSGSIDSGDAENTEDVLAAQAAPIPYDETEAISSPSGKFPGGDDAGALTGLYAASKTDDNGYFVVPFPKSGGGAHGYYLRYPTILCNGKVAQVTRISGTNDMSVQLWVDCPSEGLSYSDPPEVLKFADFDSKYTTCTPTTSGGTSGKEVVGYNEGVQDHLDFQTTEHEFDVRFAPWEGSLSALALLSGRPAEHSALWSRDCVIRKEENDALRCFTPPNAGYGDELDDGNNLEDSLVANRWDVLPFHNTMEAYRRFESRVNLTTQAEQYDSAAKNFKQMWWNPVGKLSVRYEGDPAEELVDCENYKRSNSPIGSLDTGILSMQVAGGPASLNLHPYLDEEIYMRDVERNSSALSTPYCKKEGTTYTIGDVEPPKSWTKISRKGTYALGAEYFSPKILVVGGGSSTIKHSDSRYDSVLQADDRSTEFTIEDAAQRPGTTKSSIIYPEDTNKTNTTQGNVAISTKGAYTGGALVDVYGRPFNEGYEIPMDGNTLWVFGANIQPRCSISGTGSAEKDNDFTEATAHRESKTMATSIVYTPTSAERDKLYNSEGVPNQDFIDSMLSLWDVHESKKGGSGIGVLDIINASLGALGFKNSGDQKSFKDKANYDLTLRPSLTVNYSLSEENFEDVFPAYDGSGMNWKSGESAVYPWSDVPYVEDENNITGYCNVHPGPGGDPVKEGLRTCRVARCESRMKDSNCRRKDPNDPKTCLVDWEVEDIIDSCTADQVTACLTSQRDTWGEYPEDPDPGRRSGPIVACDLEVAGGYTEMPDLTTQTAMRATQRQDESDQADLAPVVAGANNLVAGFASPYAGSVTYKRGALITANQSRNDNTGIYYGVGKDTEGVGDAGTMSAYLSIVAHPTIFYNWENPANENGEISSVKRLFAGPAFGADFVEYIPNEDRPIYRFAPTKSQALPPIVTVSMVKEHAAAKPQCGVSVCSIENSGDIIPSFLYDIANAAAADWDVPASVLLSYMYGEGSFATASGPGGVPVWSRYDWNNKNAYYWSLPVEGTMQLKGNRLPCDDMSWAEQGAISFYLKAWDNYKDGVDKISPGRGAIARRCNLLDSMYALAKYAYIEVNGSAEGAGKSCSAWTQADIEKTVRAFMGPVDDPNGAVFSGMNGFIGSCSRP